jgi:hypothetical protein
MAAAITATGTWTVPQVVGQNTGGSGVLFKGAGGIAFDSRQSLQRGLNLYDEFTQFVALMAAALGVPGNVVLDQLHLMISDYRRNPAMGERVYAP